jgi:hypothetical protein
LALSRFAAPRRTFYVLLFFNKSADKRAFRCNQVFKKPKEQARSTALGPRCISNRFLSYQSGGQQNKEKMSGRETHANYDLGIKILSGHTSES